MRVLYVCRSLAYWGGIERIMADKMNYLVTMYDYEVYMLTTDQGKHPIPFQLEKNVCFEDLGICFHQQYRHYGLKRLLILKKKVGVFKQRLLEHIMTIRPDVIVCTTANWLDINILVKIKGTIPLIVESHSIYQRTLVKKGLSNRLAYFMFRKGLSKAQVIVALTEDDAIKWRMIHPHVEVIPNLVHMNRSIAAPLENKRVIWVGRFDYQKQPMEIIKIWQQIFPKYSDWCLEIYGEGEQRQELEDTAMALDMNIHIHQPIERIFDAYRESSTLVSTSLFEPFGLVLPEAMSCGLPVVAFDCPYGPADIITDGVDGFLVRNRNIEEFADRVCLLISDASMRRKMGQMGIQSSKKYSVEEIMPMWKTLFERIYKKR